MGDSVVLKASTLAGCRRSKSVFLYDGRDGAEGRMARVTEELVDYGLPGLDASAEGGKGGHCGFVVFLGARAGAVADDMDGEATVYEAFGRKVEADM